MKPHTSGDLFPDLAGSTAGWILSIIVSCCICGFLFVTPAVAGSDTESALQGLSIGALAYIDYSYGEHPEPGNSTSSFNRFTVTRGYVTVKKKMLSWLRMRATLDIHQDETGDYKRREKYFYAELRPPDIGFLTGMISEIGLSHMPWLDYEEHMNPYRCQGTMTVERAGIFNSADAGVSLRGNFGGELADAETKTGNHSYTGRWGTWHLGVYNGPGYHAAERNENKVIQGRISVRPLPDILPGLVVNYFGLYGKGNTYSAPLGDYPDYIVHLGMVSYEHPRGVVTAQAFQSEGNAKGSWTAPLSGKALSTRGLSIFGNLVLPGAANRLSLFGRLDQFDVDHDDIIARDSGYLMGLEGAAFRLHGGNLVLVTYEQTAFQENSGAKKKLPIVGQDLGDEQKMQVVYQIKF